MWTLELRYHHHSQILGSPSKYSQRHREQGCAYNVKEMRFVNKRNAHDTKHHKSLQRQHPVTKHGFKTQTARGARTYTKVTAFLVLIHFLLMKIKMPMTAQTRQRLPTRQVTMSGGSTGIETSSSQCSPWQCQYLPTGHLKEMRTNIQVREKHTVYYIRRKLSDCRK